MARPPFTYTFGELIDKLSIISKKDRFNLPGARQELDTIMKWLNDLGIDAYLILSIIRVTEANMSVWGLEHELRNAKEGDIPLDQVGRIAIKVREHNKSRVRYMNELDRLCGAEHITEKVKHLSEDIYDKFYKREC
jgi:hypothetical protein